MTLAGPEGLFFASALFSLVLALEISRRRRANVMPVVYETEPFQLVGDVTPAALEMDPRTEVHELGPDLPEGGWTPDVRSA